MASLRNCHPRDGGGPLKDFLKKRPWQDWVFLVGSVIFSISLIPMLLNPAIVVPLSSSVPTALVLWVYTGTQWTLNLRLSSVMTAATAASWSAIAVWRN